MALKNKTAELKRLVSAFESEAVKFHPLSLTTFYVTLEGPGIDRPFVTPNHAIVLWQYMGAIESTEDADYLASNVTGSNLQWGLRGADLTLYAVLEGEGCELFVRMAQRAGSLFDDDEARSIKNNVVDELVAAEQQRRPSAKPVSGCNNNPLALWLNYLLYHLSLTNPGREHSRKIEPDPFSLSLLALERLVAESSAGKIDRSIRSLSELSFQVAMSFPGEHRAYVASVVQSLRVPLGPDTIFYDHDYQAQLAIPNLDTLLQDIYRNRSELVVVFLSEKYAQKEWCGLEWRAIREIIKAKNDEQIMFVRFDDAKIDGVFSIDGHIDARIYEPAALAGFIQTRLRELGIFL
jgi:uncharacterized protein YqfB (UPF0267 family)